jgi:hypothetical protein
MNTEHHFLPHVFAKSTNGPFHKFKSEIKFVLYETTVVLNAFYHACCFYGLKLVIIPVWCIFEENAEVYDIPDDVWLIQRNQTIANLSIFKDVSVPVSNIETNSGDKDILLAAHNENKYINPCWFHPNKEGHEKIAAKIIELL